MGVDNTNEKPSRLNCSRFVDGHLNRLLSFSSSEEDGDDSSLPATNGTTNENFLNRSNSSDYFFHDALPEAGALEEWANTTVRVLQPNITIPAQDHNQNQNANNNKPSPPFAPRRGGGGSSNGLVRRSSFSSPRSRGLANFGRQ
eukprot:jgi/Psemu1/308747/fgenesh1_kg.441_\